LNIKLFFVKELYIKERRKIAILKATYQENIWVRMEEQVRGFEESSKARITKGNRRVMAEHVSGIGRRGIDEGCC
jgi:hypothetical protein